MYKCPANYRENGVAVFCTLDEGHGGTCSFMQNQRTHTLAVMAAMLYAGDLNRPTADIADLATELLVELERRNP